jgi:hypothetical protein
MVSLINSDNLSSIGKIIVIITVVFFILYNFANIDKYQSILLAVIVAVSIIIIENIIYINTMATDPLNCEQCKITDIDPNKIVKSELVASPEHINPEFSEGNVEGFANNLSELMNDFSKNFTKKSEKLPINEQNTQNEKNTQKEQNNIQPDISILNSADNGYKFKCVRLPNNFNEDDLNTMNVDELRTFVKNKLKNESELVNKLEEENNKLKTKNEIMEKNKEINSLKNEIQTQIIKMDKKYVNNNENSDPFNNGSNASEMSSSNSIENFSNLDSTIDDSEDDNNSENGSDLLNKYMETQNKKNKKLGKKNKTSPKKIIENNELPSDVKEKIKKVKKELSNKKISKKISKKKQKNNNVNDEKSINSTTSSNSGNSEIPNTNNDDATYDANYVEYQQDGLQKDANKISEEQNIFRMSVGNPNIVKPYIKDGEKYYDNIFSVSTGAPTANQAQNNELKYGYYNYLGPINKGMINKDYTFISPENWYPIPPFPQVCVTNKRCTTCPIQISDGKDYMSFASVEDFDKARRFTGNMNINTDYIKEVLNNPEGF